MLSWRFEVSPYRTGGTERGDNLESRVDRFGCGVGPWNRRLALPSKCGSAAGDRFEFAVAVSVGVEEGQHFPLLGKFVADVRSLPEVKALK